MTRRTLRWIAPFAFVWVGAACSGGDGALPDGSGDGGDGDGAASSDVDGDGVPNAADNCPNASNPGQEDRDSDTVGDACDNCAEIANYDQADADRDGIGDACERPIDPSGDDDGDGVPNDTDNCWRVSNPDQADTDRDGVGDACDNCPGVANYDQLDSDADGRGDACAADMSSDDDGDGVDDSIDNCRGVSNPGQEDADHDLVGDACDNCPSVANYDQADADGDGTGDACEGGSSGWDPTRDSDGDGVPDIMDNCRMLSNPGQADGDGDGVGDPCDNCPTVANYGQEDLDANGVGDACEIPPDITPACADDMISGMLVKPNLYLVLDRSGSMDYHPCDCSSRTSCTDCPSPCLYCGTTRWAELSSGLDALAPALRRDFNVGIAAFPTPVAQCDVSLPAFELLDLQPGWTAAQVRAAYATVAPNGRTPAQEALDQVRTMALYNFPADTVATRPKAVVLITDGEPNCAGDVTSTANAARALYRAGVPVYVIGFDNLNPADMDLIAERGRGLPHTAAVNDWFPVTDRASITAALTTITSAIASCTVSLVLDGDEDLSRLRVESVIDGAATAVAPGAPDGYDFDAATGTVTLLGASCAMLQSAASMGSTVSVRARAACACVPMTEECDYIDNDCDGEVDEGCMSCPPEACDGVDNDCDGMVDEGCPPPGCTPRAEICDGVDNDCDGMIDEGCPPPGCVPSTEICNGVDDDCDGEIDEGCVPMCMPTGEICDGIDNDCDGLVDEGCPMIF